MDPKILELVLEYGGFGVLALFFLWDKKESNKRYDQLQSQYLESQNKQNDILGKMQIAMTELKEGFKYNLLCPLIQQTTKPKRVRKKSESGKTDSFSD